MSQPTPPPPPRPGGQASAIDNARILVADDNEANRDMLSRRLRALGYRVDTAVDGEQTLKMIQAERFDLLLLDVMMPGISGVEVLRTIRAKQGPADLPVIMATAMNDREMVVETLKIGANDYVTKPIDFPVALARVRTHLSLKFAKDQADKLAEELNVRNRFIQETFGRYLSDEVVANLLNNPKGLELGGKKAKVTVLMTDIRGFSAMSERMPPDMLVRLLNNYFREMTTVIMSYNGMIDEFLGDAILAIFGVPFSKPDDCTRAIACALAMQLAMGKVNRIMEREGLPRIEMAIAVHTGEVIVGNIGSEARVKYGVVGSHVNLTSRIESMAVGGQILISESALRLAGVPLSVAEEIELEAKGFRDPIKVYDLRGMAGTHQLFLSDRFEPLIQLRRQIDARCSVIVGEEMGESFNGSFLRLSSIEGELATEIPIPPMTEIKIRVRNAGGKEIEHDLYGKVLELSTEGRPRVLIRFSSIPPELGKMMEEWRR